LKAAWPVRSNRSAIHHENAMFCIFTSLAFGLVCAIKGSRKVGRK
jgi:hypothetical protein